MFGNDNFLTPLKRVKRRLSPLTLRIMAVNVLALAILVGAILYLGRYQDRLMEAELVALSNEAKIFASAVAEGATFARENEQDILVPSLARQMVRRLDEVTDTRTRLYDGAGVQFADSWVIGRTSIYRVEEQKLDKIGDGTWAQRVIMSGVDFLKMITPDRRHYPYYLEEDLNAPTDREEIQTALAGNLAFKIYRNNDESILFSVAIPIQRYKQVLGVMNLTRDGTNVEQAVLAVRMDIMRLFGISLLITILMSLYLAQAIARPIRRLAVAADMVRHGQMGGAAQARSKQIPDFTERNDEIGELSGSLRAMTTALWERMEAIESFAADVAHELKNPLASLRSAIETLSIVKDDAPRQKLLGIIQYDVIRLDRLITDISSASRLDAELSRIEMLPVDISKMLTTLADIYEFQEGAIGRVKLSNVQEKLVTRGVEGRLVQVIQNLVTNALSFSPELQGEGDEQRGTVRLFAQKKKGIIDIRVEDDGPGIPDSKLEAIFDRFYTERPTTEGFGQHSGLGLSISKQIIEAHGGRIFAKNRKDDNGVVLGAIFVIELPLA